VIEQALQQIPAEQIADVEIVVRADSAGATHDLLDFCREGRLRYSVGYELVARRDPEGPTEAVDRVAGDRRQPASQRADRRDHRPVGPHGVAQGVARDRQA